VNPVFVICVIGMAFLIWVSIAFLFPIIGKAIVTWIECFKYITNDNEEDDNES